MKFHLHSKILLAQNLKRTIAKKIKTTFGSLSTKKGENRSFDTLWHQEGSAFGDIVSVHEKNLKLLFVFSVFRGRDAM